MVRVKSNGVQGGRCDFVHIANGRLIAWWLFHKAFFCMDWLVYIEEKTGIGLGVEI